MPRCSPQAQTEAIQALETLYSRQAKQAGKATVGLAEFVEATASIRLDHWQVHLCNRLERLATQTGQRIAIHAPPQHGKSIIVSQRFPAWLLAQNPMERIKLACYNITHATRFGRIVKELVCSPEYRQLFPQDAIRVNPLASNEEWSTLARQSIRDAQPSFKALGLVTGFVGQGADTLIVDDPYASPQDAASEKIRASVWSFWDESARVRITEEANVVVMFHRYHEADIAGQLIEEGGWEVLRYAAEADGEPDCMPPGREIGDYLTPRRSAEYYASQEAKPWIWLSQFQGKPTAKEGLFFKIGNLEIIDAAPANLRRVRAWDMAATEGDGDYTAGVLMGTDGSGLYYVLDARRGQWSTDERDAIIRQTAQLDGREVRIRGPQDPGAAGKQAASAFTRMLSGFGVATYPVSGDKVTRADPLSSQVNAGNVKLFRGEWNRAFIEELRGFPLGIHDDQVDAAADAFAELASRRDFYLL